jgi:hypothetical protein
MSTLLKVHTWLSELIQRFIFAVWIVSRNYPREISTGLNRSMKHPINRPIRDVVNTQLRRKITLESRDDARFHASDLRCRRNAAVVSLRSIYQVATARAIRGAVASS